MRYLLSLAALAVLCGVGSRASAAITFSDDFSAYADQAAFEAAYTITQSDAGFTATLNEAADTVTIQSAGGSGNRTKIIPDAVASMVLLDSAASNTVSVGTLAPGFSGGSRLQFGLESAAGNERIYARVENNFGTDRVALLQDDNGTVSDLGIFILGGSGLGLRGGDFVFDFNGGVASISRNGTVLGSANPTLAFTGATGSAFLEMETNGGGPRGATVTNFGVTSISAIPEPGSAAVLALGIGGLVVRRRRR